MVGILHKQICSICSSKIISYPKNISAVKKGKAKKVQVTERLEGVKSLWGQEENDLPARLCRTPAYKAS